MGNLEVSDFWSGKTVLVTGTTGFKGSWLSLLLTELDANVVGLALPPDTAPSLFEQLNLAARMDHRVGDIRDASLVAELVKEVQPDLLFHLAAQPLVRRSYSEPLLTWETNVIGTANVLDAMRHCNSICAAVMVTTDKVYENREWVHAYRETDRLGGHDPYSASKAATELVVSSYRRSYFRDRPVRIASARAGNVIGGGDWAAERIVPDLMRSLASGGVLQVRNPYAVRPWQHVLDPIWAYLSLAEKLYKYEVKPAAWNFGPEPKDQRTVRELIETAFRDWAGEWKDVSDPSAPHEANRLALTIDKARSEMGWSPRWTFDDAVRETVSWYRAVHEGRSPLEVTLSQIDAFRAARP